MPDKNDEEYDTTTLGQPCRDIAELVVEQHAAGAGGYLFAVAPAAGEPALAIAANLPAAGGFSVEPTALVRARRAHEVLAHAWSVHSPSIELCKR